MPQSLYFLILWCQLFVLNFLDQFKYVHRQLHMSTALANFNHNLILLIRFVTAWLQKNIGLINHLWRDEAKSSMRLVRSIYICSKSVTNLICFTGDYQVIHIQNLQRFFVSFVSCSFMTVINRTSNGSSDFS